MYIYCGPINTLSAGMIQINLNTIFYTHVETSPKYNILYTCNGRKFVTFMQDQNIDILFLTETWLTAKGDETKCADMCPAGYSAKSFPRLSRGGGLAVIYRSSLQSYISVDATIDFDHTVFELLHLKLSVSQCAIHFLCLYRPPPARRTD